MDLDARVEVNCDQRIDMLTDRGTENRKPIWHSAKAGATTIILGTIDKVNCEQMDGQKTGQLYGTLQVPQKSF